MSFEQKIRKENYLENRNRVFEIYGINPKDPQYNCHHIVTKHDRSVGVRSKGFSIDNKSNLYPLRTALHKILNDIIEAVDSDENIDIEPLRARWVKVEADLNRPKKDKTNPVKPSRHESFGVVFFNQKIDGFVIRNPILSPRAENTTFAQKISEEELSGLQEFLVCNESP